MEKRELEKIRKTLIDLAPAPWFWHKVFYTEANVLMSDSKYGQIAFATTAHPDTDSPTIVINKIEKRFITTAREAIPALLDYIEDLHKQIERLEERK